MCFSWRHIYSEQFPIWMSIWLECKSTDHVQPALLEEGSLETLSEKVSLVVGVPLSPMLGQITRDLSEIEDRLRTDEEFVAE